MPKQAVKSTQKPIQDPEVVGQDEHLELVRSLEGGITTFFLGAGQFFTLARQFRMDAKGVLARAQALTIPTDDDGAKTVQRVVIDSNNVKKGNAEHWEPITKMFHKVHRLMTSGRGEADIDADSSARIGNRLHSDYIAEKERKARLEQQRLDAIARANAQREQEAIERRLEEERLRLEDQSPDLSDREHQFVAAYDRHGDSVRAERESGYQPGHGVKLLARVKIQSALDLLVKKREVAQQQAAAKAAPVQSVAVAPVRPSTAFAVGAGSRKQRGAQVFDESALIEAILAQCVTPPADGVPIIPTDVLTIRHPKVNEYARSLGRAVNSWPGVRYTEESKVTGS